MGRFVPLRRPVTPPPSGAQGSPMRMTKSGTQTISPFNADVRIVNWVVDAAYPATVIATNGLRTNGGGTATVSGSVDWNYNYGQHRVKVWRTRGGGDSVVFDSGIQYYPQGAKPISFSFTTGTAADDLYYLTMNTDQNFAGSGVIQAGTPTALQITY